MISTAVASRSNDPISGAQKLSQEIYMPHDLNSLTLNEETKKHNEIVDEEDRLRKISRIEEIQEGLRASLDGFKLSTIKNNELQKNLKISIDLIKDVITMQNSLVSDVDDEKTTKLFVRIANVLVILKGQLSFTYELVTLDSEKASDPSVLEGLVEQYANLGMYAIPAKSKEDISRVTLEYVLDFLLHNLLAELLKVVHNFFEKDRVVKNQDKMYGLIVIAGKLETVASYLPAAICFDQKDIFSLDKSEPYWKSLFQLVEFKEIAPAEQINKSFANFCKGVILANAMMSKGSEQQGELKKNFTIAWSAVYYFFMQSQALKQANLFIASPDMKTAFEVWNLPETKLIREMMKIILPPINYKKKIHVSRSYPTVTLDKIQSQLEASTMNNITPEWLAEKDEAEAKELFAAAHRNRDKKELLKPGGSKISVRILSHKTLPEMISCPLNTHPERKNSLFDKIFGTGYDPKDPNFNGVVLHIHGGGFASMSSASHQTYTRQWANLIRKPLFSLDYRLAPDHPYPAGLDDCWQVYNWIIDNSADVLGVNPNKIVLVGDSAGGNLALALTLLAIKSGKRVPDGLLLVYPALQLNGKKFSPSYLLSLDDQLLTYSFLKLCISAYVPAGADPDNDPLLSPNVASPELLKKLPPTRLMVGTKDPLHDESWRFIDRVHQYQPNLKMVVYKEFPHGFLNFDVPNGMKEAKETVRDAAAMLLELLEN